MGRIKVALGEVLLIRDNDAFPHIALRPLVRRRDFARWFRRGGNDSLDRLADPDSELVGRVRSYRHDPRRSRRMKLVLHSPSDRRSAAAFVRSPARQPIKL